MKTIFLLFSALLFSLSILNAQQMNSRIGLGVQVDLMNISLQPEILLLKTTGAHVIFPLNNRFNIKAAYISNNLQNVNIKQYENYNGYSLGIGYFIFDNQITNYSIELSFNFENSFNDSFKLMNHSEKFGVNFYMFKSFYIGTGIKYFQQKNTNFTNLTNNNYNWYWQLGCQIYFANKHKESKT